MNKRYAIVQNGVVLNVVVSKEDYAISNGWIEVMEDVPVEIGWIYSEGLFSNPNETV